MIRTHLVKSLYEKLLGPEEGPEETVESPFVKYVIGTLSSSFVPKKPENGETSDIGATDDAAFKSDRKFFTGKSDNSESDNEAAENFQESALDPRKGSKSLGISFTVSSASGPPKISICCTWARYEPKEGFDTRKYGIFERKPNFYVSDEISIDGEDRKIELEQGSSEKQLVTRSGVCIHIRQREISENSDKWIVAVFLENRTAFPEREAEEHRIFQPQIRVVCSEGTKTEFFEQTLTPESNTPEARDILAYQGRTGIARGHQCGAIWKDVDPGTDTTNFAEFLWKDSLFGKFPKLARDRFLVPDIRTDYFPSYTILQPTLEDRPTFDAERLANMWDEQEIRMDENDGLEKIYTNYRKWILKIRKDLDDVRADKNIIDTGKTNLELCFESLSRIEKGIDFVCKNPRAKLAFCFMNKVMAKKMRWESRENKKFDGLKWFEFQMAFILQSIRGVVGEDDKENSICDVLWFPTGGGKTEAYLGLSIFALGYRRLAPTSNFETDGGTSVLSRYTLRLLTIQQFGRAVGSTVAADLLRVQNWKPEGIRLKDLEDELQIRHLHGDLWGKSRISIALWLGGDVTPNKFKMYVSWKGDCIKNAEGMLDPAKAESAARFGSRSGGEPAQIANCPCCGNILATTSIKPKQEVRISWFVQTSKRLDELQLLTIKDFDTKNTLGVEIKSVKFSKSENPFPDEKPYYIFTASVRVVGKSKEPDHLINDWWKNVASKAITSSDSDPLMSTSASRPGYFFVYNSNGDAFDFIIHCTNFTGTCELNERGTKWFDTKVIESLANVGKPFRDPSNFNFSSSVPISAFTVDDQVYHKCPSFIIATVDKFARIPFDQRASSIFGNVNIFHRIYGYGRVGKEIFQTPLDESINKPIPLNDADFSQVKPFKPPELIIQDELHLIEGPLGSMVGIYEMAIDILSTIGNSRPKYIASSATIKEAESQVGSIYRRKIRIFPQPGIKSTDSYFAVTEDDISSCAEKPGRLYVGVCAGRGTYTIPIKTWAVLLSEIYNIRRNSQKPEYGLVQSYAKQRQILSDDGIKNFEEFVERETDPYWTLVGFFSDLELMARTSNFYRDDILRDVRSMSQDSISTISISERGLGEGKIGGIRFYKIKSAETFDALTVSVFLQSGKGKISVAIFDDDGGKPGKVVSLPIKDDLVKNCSEGDNVFQMEEAKKIEGNTQIWVAVANEKDDFHFQTGSAVDECFFSEIVGNLGNFNSATSSMKQANELPARINLNTDYRELDDNRKIELSSMTNSTELPVMLDKLQDTPNTIDALLTTPIFGTGIDIKRLGLMAVMNQPKTTSQYIQATGRVGRSNPGLVVNWLKAGRHRDLNHYENFVGYHRTIHRYVEPITASPFSEKTMDLYLGPVIVALIRNCRTFGNHHVPQDWVKRTNGDFIVGKTDSIEIKKLRDLLRPLACSELVPKIRRLDPTFFDEYFQRALNRWENTAKLTRNARLPLHYYDYSFMWTKDIKFDVVLGSIAHGIQKKKVAFNNVKTSLREIESQTGIGEKLWE